MKKATLKTFLFYSLLASMTLWFGCKSDVEDKSQAQQSPIQVDSLQLYQTTAIRESLSSESLIKSKSYTLRTCLSEVTIGEKLRFQPIRLEGAQLVTNETDNNGCAYWKHQVEHTVTSGKRCQSFKVKLSVDGTNFQKEMQYSIDIMEDALSDQALGQSCQESLKNENSNISSQEEEKNNLVLEQINLIWAGNSEMIRSDKRFHTHKTKITSCLKSSYTNESLANTQLNLSILNKELEDDSYKSTLTTDSRGCFELIFDTKYKQFSYSHWAKHNIKVDVLSGVLAGSTVSNDFYINSWETDRSFFGIDPRFNQPQENPNKINNNVFIDSVMYIQIGNDLKNFHVNEKLGLTVSRSYQVILTPKIDRGHVFGNSAQRYVKPSDGKFKLKFMLLAPNKAEIELTRDNFKDFDFITGASKIVEIRNGVVNELIDIPVRMTDLPRVATRTVAVLKLEPMDEVIELNPTVVTGFFKSKITWIRTNVLQSKDLQAPLTDFAKKFQENSPLKTSNNEKFFSDIESQNFDKDFIGKISELKLKTSNIEEKEALESLEYKAVIENFFANLDDKVTEKIQDASPLIKDLDALSIFYNDLEFKHKGIELLYAKEAEENDSSQYDTLSFNNNALDTLFDQEEYKKAEQTNPIFKTLCDKEFSGDKPNWFDKLNGQKDHNSRCKKKPFEYFKLQQYKHSEKVSKFSPQYSRGYHIGVNTSFSSSTSDARTEAVTLSAKFDMPLVDFLGYGISMSDSKTQGNSYSDGVSTSQNIAVEEFQIDVYGDFKDCTLITPKIYQTDRTCPTYKQKGICPVREKVTHHRTESNYYLCSSTREKKIQESWYFIESYSSTSNLFKDEYGPTEVKLLKVMRGKKQFAAFKTMLEDQTKNYVLTRTSGDSDAATKIYEDWGHVLDEDIEPSVFNKLIFRDFQEGFPGTVY